MNKASKKIGWGILSTARIAHQFAEDLDHVRNGRLVAVASRSENTAADFAAKHNISKAYSSYEALYEDPEIDAIYVATPHSLHLKNTSDAMRAGKAVLCEKPLTISLEQIDELERVAAETGSYLMEGMWTWFLPAIRQALAWFEAGEIGQPRHIKSDFGYPLLPFSPKRREYNADLGGGAVPEMGIYPIAMAYLFSRRDPVSIDVVSRNAPNGVEDDVIAIFDYGSYWATLSTSFRCKLPNRTYIIGDEGHIVIPDFWCAHESHLYRGDELIDSFADNRTSRGYDYEATAVGNDLLQGRKESEIVPLATSRKFQEHIEAIKACSRTARDS